MKYIYLLFISIITLSSCTQTYYVSIDVRKAAPLDLGADTKKIIIVDNSFISNNADSVYQLKNQALLTKDMVDSVRPIFMRSFIKYLNEEKLYDTVEVYPFYPKPLDMYKKAGIQIELPLEKEEAAEICSLTEADALISLELIRISLELNPYNNDKHSAQLKTKIRAKLRAYGYNGDTIGSPIIQIDSRSKSVALSDKDAIDKELKTLHLNNIEWVADMLVNSFIPKWESEERKYYIWYPNSAYKANELVNQEKWVASIPIWEEVYKKEKSWKQKARCASNTALAHEFADDIGNALKWINTAYSLLPPDNKSNLAKEIKEYKEILEQRTKEAPLLKKQLKIKENHIMHTENNL
ncbi:MAG: DUF6340 family protein [Dysgonomonas sp.]